MRTTYPDGWMKNREAFIKGLFLPVGYCGMLVISEDSRKILYIVNNFKNINKTVGLLLKDQLFEVKQRFGFLELFLTDHRSKKIPTSKLKL